MSKIFWQISTSPTVLLALLFAVLSAVLAVGCSDSSSGGESGGTVGFIITPPDAQGEIVVIGLAGVSPGEGIITLLNRSLAPDTGSPTSSPTEPIVPTASPTATTSPSSTADGGSSSHTSHTQAHHDGSFSPAKVHGKSGHKIDIHHTDQNGNKTHIATVTVPKGKVPQCPDSAERPLAVKNASSRDIWLGITAGTMSCMSDADCPTGAAGSCVGANPPSAGTCSCAVNSDNCGSVAQCSPHNGLCYFNLPDLGISQMNIPAGERTVVCFPKPSAGKNIQWSGNMFARVGCNETGQACETGECGNAADSPCPVGTGGNPPATLLEFTFTNQTGDAPSPGPDFYDVSIIGGINLAASMGPLESTYAAASGDPYSCKTAGAGTAQGDLKACTWTVNPVVAGVDQSTILRDVKPVNSTGTGCANGSQPNSLGFCSCAHDFECHAGQYCGNAQNAAPNKMFSRVCGTHIGWWTANFLCGATINDTPYGEPLNCAATVTNSDQSLSSYTNLHLCTKPAGAPNDEQAQSCYSDSAISDCCGCGTSAQSPYFSAWDLVVGNQDSGDDNGCYAHNPNWGAIAQPWLVFLKLACPTAYTYPFDDATSTFTCSSGTAKKTGPAYEVVFSDTSD